MNITEEYIQSIAPTTTAFGAGKKLSIPAKWLSYGKSERGLWGELKGSGKKPYRTQIDTVDFAYKCSCPSRQFPCKHGIALMLLYVGLDGKVEEKDEPEWVKEWLDKRTVKKEKVTEKEELTEEDITKKNNNKLKTEAKRFAEVQSGVEELELWLKDMVRIGFLELPNQRKKIDALSKRMIDAKANRLSNWVRSYAELNFNNEQVWREEAMRTTAKLFLLIKTFNNYNQLSPLWQQTIKTLVGWNQSTKELINDPEAESLEDHWLVVGQETTERDGITTQKSWLLGLQTNRNALILSFKTNYSNFDHSLSTGMLFEGTLKFFPSITPLRAVVSKQNFNLKELKVLPDFMDNMNEIYQLRAETLKKNPWELEQLVCLKSVQLVLQEKGNLICDTFQNYIPIEDDCPEDVLLNWYALEGSSPAHIVGLFRNGKLLPLGLFNQQKYLKL
ncbi:SWIM zinc finger family protein [Flammeovirga aprica]|uniref:SWIM zinc finger family protein n=1 Tax=Flammeovirga aprica JL-4 TaxID=694437 RepID=A0A7X9RXE7_9BACT|nr:SWIM zinc finger family protein [Flammeovirga aprica]NME70476.1 SWIM zinc finger family protein [Flammeovirga aprica JL-4]